MSEIIKKFKVLNKLKEEFLNEIKLSYIFKNNNVLIVTNDDKVFAFGSNNNGVLGFGNDREVNELTINEDLSHKQIIDFKNSDCHVVARTIDGKVYCWGYNIFGVLGNGKNDRVIYSPKLNQYLSDKQIIDICCGFRHTLVLTNSGEVYAWGDNKKGQIGNGKSGENECQLIPIKVNGFNDEKVIHISCGGWHSMALTESGRVFSWGNNSSRQLGQNNNKNAINQPTFVSLNNEISIKKISCGLEHSLLLSREAHLYWFGNNGIEKQMTPKKLTINTNKLIDIASHYNHYISIALSMNGIYYIWGNCGEIEKIKEPKETEFKSFDDIFNHYFGITYKTLNFSENTINLQNLENGKYEKEFEEKRLIGCGSFGIVHKAIGRSNGKVYAIKKIAFNDKDIEKVSKELNLITELKCNFVVGFINYWVEDNCIKAGDCIRDNKDNTLYSNESISYGHPVYNPNNTLLLHIQMEFCSKTFKQLMTELNISQSLDIINFYILCELFIELLECLNYLHSLKPPVIHRDLKPENILITDGMNGRFVKLCDFGLAVIHEFEDQSHSSRTGSFKYMAPEVFKRHYDMKADVYSLGIILQELFDLEKLKNKILEIQLKTSLKNLIELKERMLFLDKNRRPNCEEILNEKEKWSLNLYLVRENTRQLNKESFEYRFIETKLKFVNKCVKEFESVKKLKEPKEIEFKSFNDIFNHFEGITYKTSNSCNKEQNKKESILKTQIRLEEENGEKVEANKTQYNLGSAVNRFSSQSNETLSRYKSNFKELELIGSGGFGKVYKVINCHDRQQYAVKIIALKGIYKTNLIIDEINISIRVALELSDEMKEKSLKELQIMAKISSDYVVHYTHSWIENNEMLYIQMELCFNTLKGIIEQKQNEFKRNRFEVMTPLEYYISSELFIEILEAVNYLHSLKPPIIHRDLKPTNILITKGLNGRFVKLADFGLAIILEFDEQTTTEVLGSTRYVAPEVLYGRIYDMKADIYSLNVVSQDLFDVDIDLSSVMTINNSLLNEKYNNVIKSICDMMSAKKSMRPTCEQLLNNKSQWALSVSDIQNDSMFEKLKNLSISESSMKNNFCNYFIKIKSIKTVIRAEVSHDIFIKKQKQLLQNQTSRHLKTSENLNFKVDLQKKANKTEYNLGSAVNRFSSQSNETLSRYKSDYKELDIIRSGDFSKIYKVTNCLDRQQYAVKIIALKELSDEMKQKSLNELKIMAKIRSDYVVHYTHSWIENNEMLYIQMELCFNNLKGIMEQKQNEFKRKRFEVMTPLEYYISSELFKETLEAVNYLHSLKPPIIHRDLKPTNILITEGKNGRFVKLADFGLSTFHGFDEDTHTQGMGTARYIAPEVLNGRDYDMKADIFSLGGVSQELFDVDIYSSSMMTINNSLLDEKYNNVIKSICDMMLPMKSMRPTCKKLLNNKSQWALSVSNIQNDSMFEKLKNLSISESSMKNNFCKYFIKTKSMYN